MDIESESKKQEVSIEKPGKKEDPKQEEETGIVIDSEDDDFEEFE